MRKIKRFRLLSALLVLALALTLVPAAYAADNAEHRIAADHLYELGLISGTGVDADGRPIYELDRAPTRSEAITVLVKLLGKDAEAGKGGWETPFTDVPDWATNYVGYAYTSGLTAGTSATTFGGDDPVTAAQYITFVLKALGYSANGDFRWDRAWELSDKLGVTDGRYTADSQVFLRGDVFLISNAALSVQMKNSNQTLKSALLAAGAIKVDFNAIADDPVLTQRRDAAEAYMRRMLSVKWSVDKDILYTTKSGVKPEDTAEENRLLIQAGRIYQGLPYSSASGTDTAFLEYAGEPVNGVYPISGLTWESLSGGGGAYARVGNDCSSSVAIAWASVGSPLEVVDTKTMTPGRGYLRVGEYQSDSLSNDNSVETCAANGARVMYDAYEMLRNADVLVRRGSGSGHAMMVVSSTSVLDEDGFIDGDSSTVTVLQQTRAHFVRGEYYLDHDLNENVYVIGGVEDTYSYSELFEAGYLPVTCPVFVDPTPIAEPVVTDSLAAFDKSSLTLGTISCNWMIDSLTLTIADSAGASVQSATIRTSRGDDFAVNLDKFHEDNPAGVLGEVNPALLPAGSYHCTLTCRLVNGQEFTVRSFDFTA